MYIYRDIHTYKTCQITINIPIKPVKPQDLVAQSFDTCHTQTLQVLGARSGYSGFV